MMRIATVIRTNLSDSPEVVGLINENSVRREDFHVRFGGEEELFPGQKDSEKAGSLDRI